MSVLFACNLSSVASVQSLADLSDLEIFTYMASVPAARELVARKDTGSILPEDFWALSAAESMRAFLDENRRSKHREAFDLVNELEAEAKLPVLTRLSLDDSPSQCYSTGSRHLFLSNRSGNSYYAFGRVRTPGGGRLLDAVYSPTTYELNFVPLEDSQAQSLAQRVSSLAFLQVKRREDYRSHQGLGFASVWSSGDGQGYLKYWTAQTPDLPTVWTGVLWTVGSDLTKRFNYKVGDEERLNYANILLAREFPLHLDIRAAESDDAITAAILEILLRYSLDASEISTPLVQIAAEAAGEYICLEARELLEGILSQAPRAAPETGPLLQQERDLQLEIWDLAPKLKDFGVRYGQSTSTIVEAQQLIDLREQLLAQRRAIDVSEVERDRFAFQQSLEGALRKIALAEDPVALQDWVESEAVGARWALRRLHSVYPKDYAAVLEAKLQAGDSSRMGEILSHIHFVDPERGVRLAREWIEETQEDALFIDCLRILQRADAVPDESSKVAHLIEMIRGDFTNNHQRARAIGLLVPEKTPLRYTDPAVEEALLYVVNPQNSLPDTAYNYANAARALLSRDAPRYYSTVVKNTDQVLMAHQKAYLLNTLARYAMQLRATGRADCLPAFRYELKRNRKEMNSIFWVIWSNDLRALAPELVQLATTGPNDTESSDAYLGNTEMRAMRGRFHLARQIYDLWHEPNAATRAKLHIAFAYQYARFLDLTQKSRKTAVFISAFQAAVQFLNSEQRAQLLKYSKWCRAQSVAGGGDVERLQARHRALVELIATSI